MATDAKDEGLLRKAGDRAVGILTSIYNDKVLWSAFRQGANELATAFGQMSQDAATVVEPGGLFHPLHSDIDRASQQQESPHPSPSQIGRGEPSVGAANVEQGKTLGLTPDQLAEVQQAAAGASALKQTGRDVSDQQSGLLSPTPSYGPDR